MARRLAPVLTGTHGVLSLLVGAALAIAGYIEFNGQGPTHALANTTWGVLSLVSGSLLFVAGATLLLQFGFRHREIRPLAAVQFGFSLATALASLPSGRSMIAEAVRRGGDYGALEAGALRVLFFVSILAALMSAVGLLTILLPRRAD